MTGMAWEDFFIPGSNVMRNKLGKTKFGELRKVEYLETVDRQREIEEGRVQLSKDFGPDHVKAIHRHLFQDVYEWAGQFREVDMVKAGSERFGFQPFELIESDLGDLQGVVCSLDWERMDRAGFVGSSATVFMVLNQVHPFREGNGRMSKLFMQHVA